MNNQIIDRFREEHFFLSNFYQPVHIIIDGIRYRSSEAAYHALKYDDRETRFNISLLDAAEAKRYSKQHHVDGLDDSMLLANMFRVLVVKFVGDIELITKLLNTRPAKLIEGNKYGDTFWGVCDGKGLNHLGEMLMTIRDGLSSRNIQTKE